MSVFNDNNNDTLFELSAHINCENIKCYNAQKNTNIFEERSINCNAFANESNREYFTNNSLMNYLEFDKWEFNSCDPYNRGSIYQNTKDCQGFECNDDTFLIKPHNCHTYKNGIKFHSEKNSYYSYHQIFNNIKGREETPQNCETGNKYQPQVQIMSKCKPIKALAEYK